MKKLLLHLLLVLICCTATLPVAAVVTPELREQVLQKARSLAFSSSALVEELRAVGFLDDPKTAQMVAQAPPAHALAWAALQAERAHAGAAMDLLQSVAQGVAAHHADAIRYEPAFQRHFEKFPTSDPVPSPPPHKFAFDRSVVSTPDVARRLPAPAQRLLEPLAKYSGVHPGGMRGLLVDVLGLHSTLAMDIEQSSVDVSRALQTGIEHASIPPSQEQHMRDVVASLLLHGGDAIRHEEVVRRFGEDAIATAAPAPLVAHDEKGRDARQKWAVGDHDPDTDQASILALANAMVNDLRRHPDPPSHDDPDGGGARLNPVVPGPGPRPGGGDRVGRDIVLARTPTFESTVRQLHSPGVESVRAMPAFPEMRGMGAGRGGGGIIIGSAITSAVPGTPIGVSYRTIDGSDRIIPVVAMSDGRVLFAPPVRADIFLAACRVGFGDASRKVGPPSAKSTEGGVLISLLTRGSTPVPVSEFLVNPAISDLQLGRDLIAADSALFLFADATRERVARYGTPKLTSSQHVISLEQWQVEVTEGKFGDWYRYVERPETVSVVGDVLAAKATSAELPEVLFELVRPADPPEQLGGLPERAVIIQGAPEGLAEFGALNDFLRTTAITRWAAGSGARLIGRGPTVARLGEARSVTFNDEGAPSFDARAIVAIELPALRARLDAEMAEVPASKRADARKLRSALMDAAKVNLMAMELVSRGYSDGVAESAFERAARKRLARQEGAVEATLMAFLKRDLPAGDFERMKRDMKGCADSILCSEEEFFLEQIQRYETWTIGLLDAGAVE